MPAEIVAGWKNSRNWDNFIVLHSPGCFFFTQDSSFSITLTHLSVQIFYFQINQHYYKEVSA